MIDNDEETNLLFPTDINESIFRASESLVAEKKYMVSLVQQVFLDISSET